MTVPTREIRVVWLEVPGEVRRSLETLLEEWGFLIPPWVETFAVDYRPVRLVDDEASPGSVADCNTEPEYRQARLTMYGAWLNQSPEERERHVVHELLHIALAPMVLEHDDLVSRLVGEDERLRSYAEEQWRRAFEGAVQDLRNALIHVGDVPPTVLRSENGSVAQ